jgi:hypothetical protein
MFNGRKLLIVSKHSKEKVIAPILDKILGVQCIVSDNFDTDKLGTFTGEVDRKNDPLETARQKCLQALAHSSYDLAVSSEGSFGPHPSIPFAHADDEILYFMDKKNELDIFVRVITPETNFNARKITTKAELKEFSKQIKFPSHAVIIKKEQHNFDEMVKGINDSKKLMDVFNYFCEAFGGAYLETDMRAMYNPTRMQTIEKATQKLATKINHVCPTCNTPGLGITSIKEGLRCSLCNRPTRSTLSYLYECQKCNFIKEEMFPNHKEKEDPMYCDFCNP